MAKVVTLIIQDDDDLPSGVVGTMMSIQIDTGDIEWEGEGYVTEVEDV